MAIPAAAPTFGELIRALDEGNKQFKAMEQITSPTDNGKYRHWDTIRRMQPPEGLTHEGWWLGLKFRRSASAKHLSFLAKDGTPFQFSIVDPIPEKLHALDLSSGGVIGSAPKVLNADTRDRYYISSLMEEAITSSQLEGAATTTQVARDMLSNDRAPRNRDEQMIFNNYITMRKIGEERDAPLTMDRVFEIHRLITQDTLDNPGAAGRFRTDEDGSVYVHDRMTGEIQHRPPDAATLNGRIQLLCKFANGQGEEGFVHPVLRAIIVHFMLAYDHPFVDGNGRTARALFYWTMLHHGYWLFEFLTISPLLKKSPGRYARAFLYTETDENDLTYFILHQLDVISKARGALDAYIARKTRQQGVVDMKLRGQVRLNHRQVALLSHAVRHPTHRYNITSHQTRHGVAYQTARTDLFGLHDKGLITRSKIGKTYFFNPVANLEKALEELGAAGG